jgi:hypothetical protein
MTTPPAGAVPGSIHTSMPTALGSGQWRSALLERDQVPLVPREQGTGTDAGGTRAENTGSDNGDHGAARARGSQPWQCAAPGERLFRELTARVKNCHRTGLYRLGTHAPPSRSRVSVDLNIARGSAVMALSRVARLAVRSVPELWLCRAAN